MDYSQLVFDRKPIVHCITNIVTANDCANALLAVGASPTMAHHPNEMEEIQRGCDALVCNLGATENFDAMMEAAKTATECNQPIVIDPVGCSGSSYRREFFGKLIKSCKPNVIRGNYAEIIALVRDMSTVTGVDATGFTKEDDNVRQCALELSKMTGAIVIASGKVDVICNSSKKDIDRVVKVSGGDNMMSRITGSGCMVSSLLGAYMSVDDSLESAVACCERIKRAGEEAGVLTKKQSGGTMTFRTLFIDKLYKND